MARDRASRPEAKPLRLFIAIEVDPKAKERAITAIEPWQRSFPKARWVPPENWHVTMKFLGTTWPRLMGWVEEQIGSSAATASRFETRLTGLGAFPSAGRARVVWVGLDDAGGAMTSLAASLDEALAMEFAPEKRPFQAHLTVARSDPPLRLPAAFAETRLESEPFAVGRILLIRSHLRRPAPWYEPIGTYALGS
jgi:2'-5' RNA ligase